MQRKEGSTHSTKCVPPVPALGRQDDGPSVCGMASWMQRVSMLSVSAVKTEQGQASAYLREGPSWWIWGGHSSLHGPSHAWHHQSCPANCTHWLQLCVTSLHWATLLGLQGHHLLIAGHLWYSVLTALPGQTGRPGTAALNVTNQSALDTCTPPVVTVCRR